MQKLIEIHTLIHALSKAEKRSYRIAHASNQKSQVQTLFNILLQYPQFNEIEITKQFAKSQLQAQLPTHLLRLRKSILKSLSIHATDRTVDGKLRLALAEIEILFQKQLLGQLPPRIRKARQLALKFSRFPAILQLIKWERRLILETQPNQIEKAYLPLRNAEAQYLEALVLQREAADLQMRMRSLSREILRPSTPSDLARFQDIIESPSLAPALASSDFLTAIYALHTLGLYYISMQKYQKAFATYTQLMEAWKTQPKWINEQTSLFLANFNNFQISFLYLFTNDHRIPKTYTDFFARHTFAEPRIKLRFQHIYYSNELVLYLNSARFQEGMALATTIEAWLNKYQIDLPKSTKLTFHFNLAIFHFLAGQPSPANRQIQAILNFPEGEQRRDIRNFAHLFELILLKELKATDLVEYRLRSAKRYFATPERQSSFASIVLEYFRYQKQLSPKDKLDQLHTALSNLEAPQIGLQEVLIWVNSKQKGKSITQIFQEKIGEIPKP